MRRVTVLPTLPAQDANDDNDDDIDIADESVDVNNSDDGNEEEDDGAEIDEDGEDDELELLGLDLQSLSGAISEEAGQSSVRDDITRAIAEEAGCQISVLKMMIYWRTRCKLVHPVLRLVGSK
ncbi:hypothetical protein PHISP_02403 [Aspergillus sp. HF37]|nr:hypothetical protein PHISP_02403 [Aspergillus sp. HF37]